MPAPTDSHERPFTPAPDVRPLTEYLVGLGLRFCTPWRMESPSDAAMRSMLAGRPASRQSSKRKEMPGRCPISPVISAPPSGESIAPPKAAGFPAGRANTSELSACLVLPPLPPRSPRRAKSACRTHPQATGRNAPAPTAPACGAKPSDSRSGYARRIRAVEAGKFRAPPGPPRLAPQAAFLTT